jgi:hypothetical protein
LAIHNDPGASPSTWKPIKVKTAAGDVFVKEAWEFGSVVAVEGSNRAELKLKPNAEVLDPTIGTLLLPPVQVTVRVQFGNNGVGELTLNIVS